MLRQKLRISRNQRRRLKNCPIGPFAFPRAIGGTRWTTYRLASFETLLSAGAAGAPPETGRLGAAVLENIFPASALTSEHISEPEAGGSNGFESKAGQQPCGACIPGIRQQEGLRALMES
jgi:hypothetical protein